MHSVSVSYRRRKVFNVSTSCAFDPWLHFGYITIDIIDNGPDYTSERSRRCLFLFMTECRILAKNYFSVEAVMLTGSTTKDESREITFRMTQGAEGDRDIKLCYVTVRFVLSSLGVKSYRDG